MMAGAEHFFQGRDPLKCLVYTIFEQGSHAVQARLSPNRLRRLAVESHLTDGGVQTEQLENTQPAPVASVMTVIAATAAHEGSADETFRGKPGRLDFTGWRMVRLLAFGTDDSHEALSHDRNHTGSHEEGWNADIEQTCNSARRIVRMQRTKNQVYRQRRLNRDVSCLIISDFTHENNVGRWPQHGPNDAREIQSDLMFHFHLIHAGQIVFDGLPRRYDLSIRPVRRVQCRIKGRCLARAGRAGNEHDAVRTFDDALEALVIVLCEAEVSNVHLNT